MPQRVTETDRVWSRLFSGGTGASVVLVSPPPSTANDEAAIWEDLDQRAAEDMRSRLSPLWHNADVSGPLIAMTIAFATGTEGADDVEVFAVVDGIGFRRKLTPSTEAATNPLAHEIRIHPRDGRPPGRRLLSRLGLGPVHDALEVALEKPAAAARLGPRWAMERPRPGRRGRDDLHYARAALDYVNALKAAPRTPVRWMVEQAAARGEIVTPDEVRARLRRARAPERDLLTPAPPGRAGGELTEKAKALLRDVGLIEEDDDGER